MSQFDLIFALLSLLLGLSIAELLSGFARVLRLKARQRAVAKGLVRVTEADDAPPPVRVGWLVPLLGLYVLIDQLSFFTAAFAYRDALPFNLFTLMAITAVVGGYYVVASLVFPAEPGDWPDFDSYYDEHKRLVLGFALLAATVQFALATVFKSHDPASAARFAAHPDLTTFLVIVVFTLWPLLIAAWKVRGRRLNAVLLALLTLRNVVLAVFTLLLNT